MSNIQALVVGLRLRENFAPQLLEIFAFEDVTQMGQQH